LEKGLEIGWANVLSPILEQHVPTLRLAHPRGLRRIVVLDKQAVKGTGENEEIICVVELECGCGRGIYNEHALLIRPAVGNPVGR
jgi:hypothetical protein